MREQQQTIIGQSPALAATLDHLSSLAGIDRPVLVLGERGTGKELAAERLHFLSPRWSGNLIKVNCGAITETLLESELFGHEAGAFTGATKQQVGRFERADGGTLFLDELGTMSQRLQEKLLRLIEYGEFERVGGQKTIQVDVRVVAATNANLPEMADNGEFRWDLLDRLSFDVVRLPPLRERQEDIGELANHFAVRLCAELGWELFPGFSSEALATLEAHHWPGNIRELKNVVERSIYRWGDARGEVGKVVINPFSSFEDADSTGQLTAPDTAENDHREPEPPTPGADNIQWPIDLRAQLREQEKAWVEAALQAANYSQKAAATYLALSYDQMRSLVRKHQLQTRISRKH